MVTEPFGRCQRIAAFLFRLSTFGGGPNEQPPVTCDPAEDVGSQADRRA
jgi:hypothetical protein